MVSYKAKKNKNVVLLSSQHSSNILNESNKRNQKQFSTTMRSKEALIVYSRRASRYIYSSVKYTSKRWHVPFWCNILDLTCCNAFVLYSDVFPNHYQKQSHRRRLFLSDLGYRIESKLQRKKIVHYRFMQLTKSDSSNI